MTIGRFELVEPEVGTFEVRRELGRNRERRRMIVITRTSRIGDAIDVIHRAQDAEREFLIRWVARKDGAR